MLARVYLVHLRCADSSACTHMFACSCVKCMFARAVLIARVHRCMALQGLANMLLNALNVYWAYGGLRKYFQARRERSFALGKHS